MEKKLAVFIDRDGVINHLVERGNNFFVKGKKILRTAPFNYSEFRMKENIAEALKILEDLGFLRILVSNQPDIYYGFLPKEEHEKIMSEIGKLSFSDIFLCLHGRDENCLCKKPKPGMLIAAAQKWNLDLAHSYIIGDSDADMKAALFVGCKRILIRDDCNSEVESDYTAGDLFDAALLIKKLETR